MRPIYFSALALPQVATALAAQAHDSLRPFVAYLNAAKAAAKEREARSRCRWEPVPLERPVRLRALDSLLELRLEGFAYRVADGITAAPGMPLFVGRQYRPVQPARIDESSDRVVVWLAEPLAADDDVWWAGQRCRLEAVPPSWPEQLVARRESGLARILDRAEVRGTLRVVVEGTEPVTLVNEHGTVVEHCLLSPAEGATSLQGHRTAIEWNGELEVPVEAPPDTPVLRASNGVRWTWSENTAAGRRKRGVWIHLLSPGDAEGGEDGDAGGDAESTIDPRAAFCDEGVREVRTRKGHDPRHAYRVLGFRRETYRLELDRLPPEGSTLFLPSNIAGLNRQLQAVYRLKNGPLPHQRGLLTLCEDPGKVRWRDVQPADIDRWYVLGDDRWDGTLEQRAFVRTAVGTPDLAFLEGPPGSGKTHAICELVLQLIERGRRVLLCSTTHAAVDNVLERLVGTFSQVEAVRVGLGDRVDARVRACQIDERVDALLARWREQAVMPELGDAALERAAEATILAAANLTCGTTTGILAHPYIRRSDDRSDNGREARSDDRRDDRSGPRWPHFDVLILDEASKTTFQEFLVPAQLARTWIIVGDVRQLPPFTDVRDLEASHGDVGDESGRKLPPAHQRACLLLFRLARPEAGAGRARWLVEEPAEVLDALVSEVDARRAHGDAGPDIVRVVENAASRCDVTLADLEAGTPPALRLLAADWVLVTRELRTRIARFLPADLLQATPAEHDHGPAAARFRHWCQARGRFDRPIRDGKAQHTGAPDLMAAQQEFLREETWAGQIAWRLGRLHQLSTARAGGNRVKRQREVDALLPAGATWVSAAVDAIRDIGVRSVIEALRVRRVDHRVRKRSALTDAIPEAVWRQRAVLLTHQHRMHPSISALPRELFYGGAALRDANTLQGRDERLGWSFLAHVGARRVWLDVPGMEARGANQAEVDAMQRLLEAWREAAIAPRRDGRPWEIACLSFYNRQELAIRDMLRRLTGRHRAETRFALPHTEIVCGTVDRFQGREADLVLLSLRNTRRPGHLDSPHRLNVAITRARFMLVVVGNRRYFAERCPSEELAALAEQTPVLAVGGRP